MMTYEDYGKNLANTVFENTLSQFRYDDTVLNGINNVTTKRAQELFDSILDIVKGRDIDYAQGKQLDALGDIVGADRTFAFFKKRPYFSVDNESLGFDSAKWFVNGAPIYDPGELEDERFRNIINAKIFKNHVKYGSIPEVINFVKMSFDINISLRYVEAFDWKIVVSSDIQENVIDILLSQETSDKYDHNYYMPIPIGRRIVGVIYKPKTPFAFDNPKLGFDKGLFGVSKSYV